MADEKLFVERRPEGDYAVRRPGSERASAIEPTQAEAIERAKEINNGGPVLVERVRGNLALSTINFDNRSVNLNAAGASIPSFDTSAFKTASTDQFQFHIRTFPTTFSGIRLDGINEWSPSLSKKFTVVNERVFAQVRVEAYNVLNHPVFGPPNTTVTNSAFGVINTQANRPRTLQLGARITF